MLIPLILLGDGCVRQRNAALAGRVVAAGAEAEVNGRASRVRMEWNRAVAEPPGRSQRALSTSGLKMLSPANTAVPIW